MKQLLPLMSHRFIFTYAAFKAGFQRISGIGEQANIEYICEGGRSSPAYPIGSPDKTAGKLTLEKGCGFLNPFLDPLKGLAGFRAGMPIFAPCTIMLLNENSNIKRIFAFDSGIISSWECGSLDAQKGEVLIDKLEIQHTGIYELPVPPL